MRCADACVLVNRRLDLLSICWRPFRGLPQVEPIMKKRGWIVHHYMEFLPAEANLLGINVNRGQEIKIRSVC